MKKKIQAELEKLQRLLRQEKEEDLKQYKQRMQSTSFAERRKSGVCWYPVLLEKSSFSSTEQFMVRVNRPEEHTESHLFQSGKMVSLFSNSQQNTEGSEAVNGVVNTVRENEMLLTLSTDEQPDWLYDGKLGVQLLFDEHSYREMEYGLKKLLSNADARTEKLKHVLLGDTEASFAETEQAAVPELNTSQNAAIRKVCAAKDVAIVHGPPGTGKTTTLVHAIMACLQTETQVLVCAPSNAAVDLLTEKLGEQQVDVVRVGNPARVTQEILSQTLDAKIIKHPRFKELKSLRRSAEECRAQAKKYKRNFGAEEREQRRLLYADAKQYRLEARMLSEFIREDVLAKTRVIATTLVGANNIALKGMRFSSVFIDEAAQGLEPATWLPILKADRVILAGDHHQLPPTVKSYEAARAGLSETLFEKAIARNQADVMLREQYRMHRAIMEFSSRQFYKSELVAHATVAKHCIVPDDLPVEFIDTAGCAYYEETHPESKSAKNPEEALLLFRHLRAYLQTLETLNMLDELKDIGIISPYKAQVNRLQQLYREEKKNLLQGVKLAVNTIDSFQGQERDVIYISLVRANDQQEIGFLKDTRRMNVALTRARKKLVVIGDSATICSDKFYNDFFEYINEIGGYRSAFEFM